MGMLYFSLASGNYSQDWSDTGLITTDDDWSGVDNITGFRGDGLTGSTGTDPQTILGENTTEIDVIANQTSTGLSTGGVVEFELADPVVAFQGSGTADAPYLVFYMDTTGRANVTFAATLRDIDDGTSAVQPVAFQYRVGETGDFTNIASAFVSDANTGGTTPVSFTLPGDAEDQAQVQIRAITSNAAGSDAFIGVDDIVISSDATVAATTIFEEDFTGFTGAGFAPTPSAGQLDSDIYSVTGLSDGDIAFGGTGDSGDFARGTTAGGVTTGGVYAIDRSGDTGIWFQPAGSDFTPGEFIIAVTNSAGPTDTFTLAYDLLFLNDQARGNTLEVAVSTDGTTYTDLSAFDFVTPEASDGSGVQTVAYSDSFTLGSNVATGDTFYIRFASDDLVGGGSRDELGLDNIVVTTGTVAPPATGVLSIADAGSVLEGDSGSKTVSFTVTRSGDTTGAASADWTVPPGDTDAADFAGATSGTVSFADGEDTATIDILVSGDTDIEDDEAFEIMLTNPVNATISDGTATATIADDDAPPIPIYEIQGAGHLSTYEGQTVLTTGIVTAVQDDGFYLQDAAGDGDIATSDAIFVYTRTAPTVATGDDVRVTGIVSEFIPGGASSGNLSITEIVSPTVVTVSTGNALPDAVVLGVDRVAPTEIIDDDGLTSFDPVSDGIDFYESLEFMRVSVNDPVSVSSTNRFGEFYVVANDGSGATNVSARGTVTIDGTGAILGVTDVDTGDFNPERLQIDAGDFTPGAIPDVIVGTQLENLTGVLGYSFGNFELLATEGVAIRSASPIAREGSLIVGDADNLTVATYNVLNLDPGDGAARFELLAEDIAYSLNAPDIVALQEVQDNNGATNDGTVSADVTLQMLTDAIFAESGIRYEWIDNPFIADGTNGGEPGGNIRTAFLYNPDRVDLVSGSIRSIEVAGQQTDTDNPFYDARLPLVASFEFNGSTITLVNNHFSSKGGSDPLYGSTQPPENGSADERFAQAQAVADFVATEEGSVDGVIVLGDLNEFAFEDPLDPLRDQGLSDLLGLLPVEERYSYLFEGNAQALDHIFVTSSLLGLAAIDAVHINAEFDEGDVASDHDPLLASFTIPANADPVATDDRAETKFNGSVRIDVLANDTDSDGDQLEIVSIADPGQGSVVVNSDGSLTYTPDARSRRGTDEFEYTVSDGNGGFDTATVTVEISRRGPQLDDAGIGDEGRNVLAGGSGDDFLDGRGGNDFLIGNSGDDILLGGAGDDMLVDLMGSNVLRGGEGRDVMKGGFGWNRYVFDDGDTGADIGSADVIHGLEGSIGNIIDLSLIDAIDGGSDDAFTFLGDGAFTGSSGELRYEKDGPFTQIQADTDGDQVADYVILAFGRIDFIASDFAF